MSEPDGGALRAQFTREAILADYRLGHRSRQASLIGRREVLTGKAKFGIFGDGKEVRAARHGARLPPRRLPLRLLPRPDLHVRDRRASPSSSSSPSSTPTPTRRASPCSAGRQMNAHFATRLLDRRHGEWLDQTVRRNSSADISPTAAQMPRLVGLGLRLAPLPRARPELAGMHRLLPPAATRSPSARSATPPAPRGCSGRRSTPSACCRPPCCSRSGTTATASRCRTSTSSPRATSTTLLRRLPARTRACGDGIDLYTVARLGLPGARRRPTSRRPRRRAASTCRRSSTSPS